MLRNPVYVGRHVFRSRHGEITRAVPPLVDQQTWEQAQAQIERNRHLPKSGATRIYLLRGLIRCSICGATYIGATRARSADTSVSYYRCGGRMQSRFPLQRFHTGGRHIPAQWLEEFIWSYCREFVQNPGAALEGACQQLEERTETGKGWAREQATLQHALGEKALERDRVLTLFRRGRVSIDGIEAQLEAIAREEADLRQRLAMFEAQQQATAVFEGQYHDAHTLLTRLQTQLAEIEQTNDQATKRRVIELLVSDILVEHNVESDTATHQTKIRVIYRFSPRDTQISLPLQELGTLQQRQAVEVV
jgi:site-specific DNA recombinase